jgi:chromosome segregation ATPase
MAMAVQAAEERWSKERLDLEAEIASLKQQRERDAESMRQSAALVTMLQETHAALIASNEHLLGEVEQQKAQHALEVDAFRKNFAEVTSQLQRERAMHAMSPPMVAMNTLEAARGGGAGAVHKEVVKKVAAGGGRRVPGRAVHGNGP